MLFKPPEPEDPGSIHQDKFIIYSQDLKYC